MNSQARQANGLSSTKLQAEQAGASILTSGCRAFHVIMALYLVRAWGLSWTCWHSMSAFYPTSNPHPPMKNLISLSLSLLLPALALASNVLVLTDDNFDSHIGQSKGALVEF